jgi:hypothetical protein
MQYLSIVAVSVIAAVTYGVLHDQLTVRVCLEYFTIFHPQVFPTTSPTLLGLGWGVIATWWVGLPLGVVLGGAARTRSAPKRTARELLPGLALLMAATGFAAGVAGVSGFLAARAGTAAPPGWIQSMLPAEKHAAFVADLWAHRTSYVAGGLGGVTLAIWVWLERHYRAGCIARQAAGSPAT